MDKLPARIRAIICKQWKKPKTQIKNLVKCGFSLDNARGLAYCRRWYTFVAHSQILQKAISKERLQNKNKKLGRRGLVFALDYYLAWNKTYKLNRPLPNGTMWWCERGWKFYLIKFSTLHDYKIYNITLKFSENYWKNYMI